MAVKEYTSNVFINCPFDAAYKDTFHAIVFAVFDCNFRARCALEEEDCGEVRMEKISRIILQCKYGIHDISRTELCETTNLPRFNMPLELGIFLGAKKYGASNHRKKTCLILDREEYRYQIFISDIAGQDIRNHSGSPKNAIRLVTDWLRNASKRTTVPGGRVVAGRYGVFKERLPEMCELSDLTEEEIGFNDYSTLVSAWIKVNLRS